MKKVNSLFGSLSEYKKKISEKEALKETINTVAESIAKEGLYNEVENGHIGRYMKSGVKLWE